MEKTILDYQFRVKKLNALELLALQTQISFDSYEQSKTMYGLMLENIEVQVGEKWISVKEKNRDIFYPTNLENDVEMMKELVSMFMEYFSSVFPKSND